MSVDIMDESGDETEFTNVGWAFLLEFAMAYGWKPARTIAPAGKKDWDGNYDLPEGQTIEGSDGEAFANAIATGLNASDRVEISEQLADTLSRKSGLSIQSFKFAPKSVDYWMKFVAIALKGSFCIS